MRVPVAVTLESRDGSVSKDARVVNGILEPRGDQPILRKRPGVSDVGQVWPRGTAQLLYPWNALWAIYGDTLFTGTTSTIVTPSFTTLNPADKGSAVTLSNGNLTATFAVSSNIMVRAVQSKSVGKFYWEVTAGAIPNVIVGIAKSGATLNNYLGQDANGWGYYGFNGNMTNNAVSSAYGATYTTGDVIGVALDCDNGTLTFYKNGVSQGQAFSSLSGTFFPAVSGSTGAAESCTINFGATAFAFTPPTGFTGGIATTGTSLGPTTGGLGFDAQEVGASAATQLMMIKNRTQAWTITRGGVKSAVSFPSSMGAATYSVSSLIRSGATATATLTTDPGVNVGDSITVAGASPSNYNVTANVTAVTPYSSVTAGTVIITSLTRSGTTATAVTSGAHLLTNGNGYAISGATGAAYNGTYTVAVTGASSFTYTVSVTTFSAWNAAATWNPSDKDSHVTLSNGNLTATVNNSGGSYPTVRSTVGKSSGKFVFEFTVTSATSLQIGVETAASSLTSYVGSQSTSWGYAIAGYVYHNGAASGPYASFTVGDVIGVRADMDNGIVSFFKNGIYQTALTGVTGTVYAAISSNTAGGGTANFGAGSLLYNYDDPIATDIGSPSVARPASTTNATVSYPVSGSPTTPATGTITLTTNGGMVPGLPYIDGSLFVMDQNGVMWESAIDDPTSWPALNNLTAQNENGKGKALAKALNYLLAFKEWSTEFYHDAHVSPGFSFLPVDNGFTQVGCASGDSLTRIDGNLVWVSQVKERGRSVHLMTGLQQQKISTPDVERILNNDDLATVYALGLKLGGHSLYILTLITSNITLVYDLTSQLWDQWSSLTAGNALSVSSITRADEVATVTTSGAHGLSDGDPVTIAGAAQGEYNGTFQISYASPTSFSILVAQSAATPATGTITATPYTSSYFKFTKYCDYQGLNLFLHETNGHLYQMLPSLYQDAGVPIDLMFRTARLDGGSTEVKVMSRLTVVGDKLADTMMIRQSDDDCNTFSAYRPVDLSLERPSLRRLGKFRRRTIEGRHIGNTSPRIEALEMEVPQ